MADCEYAWSSLETNAKIFKHPRNTSEKRIHITQKPVKLYEWILSNYAKEGDKIFDSHMGSGSIAIACHNMEFELTACELDKDYFNSAMDRIENHKKQLRLF
jgi:site-specific DNA-methyltransferase (adenine-specific)